MGLLLATVIFLVVLSRVGRIGPFVWAGHPVGRWAVGPHGWASGSLDRSTTPTTGAPTDASVPAGPPASGWTPHRPGLGGPVHGFGPLLPAAARDPERVLALRLAEGQLTPEEYLERLSVLQSR